MNFCMLHSREWHSLFWRMPYANRENDICHSRGWCRLCLRVTIPFKRMTLTYQIMTIDVHEVADSIYRGLWSPFERITLTSQEMTVSINKDDGSHSRVHCSHSRGWCTLFPRIMITIWKFQYPFARKMLAVCKDDNHHWRAWRSLITYLLDYCEPGYM